MKTTDQSDGEVFVETFLRVVEQESKEVKWREGQRRTLNRQGSNQKETLSPSINITDKRKVVK